MAQGLAHFPRPTPIDAYGNGGFRFAGMSHRGSLLILPSGIYGWAVPDSGSLTVAALDQVIAERENIGFLLLGMGVAMRRPDPEVRRAFEAAGVGLEPMDTGAACRTFNVLLAERRPVAAALIAVV